MNENTSEKEPVKSQAQPAEPRRPNERSSISVSGFVKIFDPATQEVFVETRS